MESCTAEMATRPPPPMMTDATNVGMELAWRYATARMLAVAELARAETIGARAVPLIVAALAPAWTADVATRPVARMVGVDRDAFVAVVAPRAVPLIVGAVMAPRTAAAFSDASARMVAVLVPPLAATLLRSPDAPILTVAVVAGALGFVIGT